MAYKKKYRSKSRGSKRSRRGKSSRSTKNIEAAVKKVLAKKTETKYFDIGGENFQLWHNTGFGTGVPPFPISSVPAFFNPWSRIAPGTGRLGRIGDKITPRGMKVNLWLAPKDDRPNIMFRIIVCVLPKTYNGVVTTSQFDPFQIPNSGLLGNNLLLPLDKDKGVKALYDKVVTINQGYNAVSSGTTALPSANMYRREAHVMKSLWIRRKRSSDIVFDTVSVDIVNRPLAMYVLPYDSFGTLTTDNIASGACFMRMYYKDI